MALLFFDSSGQNVLHLGKVEPLLPMDDKFIIERLHAQDKKIFDTVFTYYYSGLCAFVYQYINDRDAVEDLVQDFFVKFWTENQSLEITGSLKAYLFSSVKNSALDYLKHQQVKTKYKDQFLATNEITCESHEYAESELMEIIDQQLLKLPPRCREIFTLSRFKGISNKEIAESLNISKRTVELQISNALKALKKALADY